MRRSLAVLIILLASLRPAVGGEKEYSCNMMALTTEERELYGKLATTLLASVEEQKELRNGYAFRLPANKIVDAAQWVTFERQCCPFFDFELEIAKDGGPVWLRVTGAKGVKEFIRAEFQL